MTDLTHELIAIIDKLKSNVKAKEHWDEEERLDEQRRRNRSISEARLHGLPARIANTLNNMYDTTALKNVRKWMDETDKNVWCLILCAPKGTGKSTAAGMWHASMYCEHTPYYTVPTKTWWQATEIANASNYEQTWRDILTGRALVIDDLGTEYLDAKGNFSSKFDGLIDARYANYRKTLITTNLGHDDIKRRYGDRVYDRLCQGVKWSYWKGNSLRR